MVTESKTEYDSLGLACRVENTIRLFGGSLAESKTQYDSLGARSQSRKRDTALRDLAHRAEITIRLYKPHITTEFSSKTNNNSILF